MTNLRKKRLLLLATKPRNHKQYYYQYCKLINEELIYWQLGTAFLTKRGEKYLSEL